MMDAVTGGMVVLAATFAAALIFAWVWAATEAPSPVPWVARAVAALIALVLLGRWVDSWDRRRSDTPAAASTAVAQQGLLLQTLVPQVPGQCRSYRTVLGGLIRCELMLHAVGGQVGVPHQVSRPTGRWVWGSGASLPTWVVDDHFAETDPNPPPEPFGWEAHNAAQAARRRPDEPRP